jgi:hypothetical protein
MSKETLEEVAEKYADFSNDHVPICFGDKFNPTSKADFIAGANYQAERMYSEEEVNNMFDTLKRNSIDNAVTISNVDLFIDSWKREFKNKKHAR